MRILRSKNIFGLLFAVLLAIPMIDIAVRCIYVQSNKNAKDSYSGVNGYEIQYRYTTNEVNSTDDLQSGNMYQFTANNQSNLNLKLFTTEIVILQGENQYIIYDNLYYITPQSSYLYLFSDTALLGLLTYDNGQLQIGCLFNPLTLSSSNTYPLDNFTEYSMYNPIENVLISNEGTLDNAFEYSVNQFITNNNFGKLNFFNWFTSLFFENNAKANTYMQFANWYMNYALLISLAYILFMVLMWFINFVRKLLDKGMSFGEGSY